MTKDGVHRLPPTGISVLVVGAGVGGLMTALECWRQGHDVRIIERASSLETIGDTFGILPSGVSTLRFFPGLHKDFEATGYYASGLSFYAHSGRQVIAPRPAAWDLPGSVHAARDVKVAWIRRRADLSIAMDAQLRRLGICVEYGKKVVKYDEDETKGFVRTEDGHTYYADLVVAADGIGTKSHHHITGHEAPAMSSGYAVFRGKIPLDCLQNASREAQDKYHPGPNPEFRLYLAEHMHMNLILISDAIWYVITHKDNGTAEETWRSNSSAADVLQVMDTVPGWDPLLREVMACTPQDCVIDWKLLWRNPQPKWSSDGGRVVQLGDSAHSFVPTSGNGATQAMEDALSLATCLRLGGSDRVMDSVRAHVLMRFERVSTLQRYGFANRQILHFADVDEMEKNPGDFKFNLGRWIWEHDPAKYARDNFSKALKVIVYGGEFENTNLPLGHKYVPWTVESELEREKQGLRSTLYDTGDWDASTSPSMTKESSGEW